MLRFWMEDEASANGGQDMQMCVDECPEWSRKEDWNRECHQQWTFCSIRLPEGGASYDANGNLAVNVTDLHCYSDHCDSGTVRNNDTGTCECTDGK